MYDVIRLFFRKLKEDDITEKANAVAYSLTLAIFPGIIFLFTLVPHIHKVIPAVDEASIIQFLEEWIPPNMFEVVDSTLVDIIGNSRGDLLTFGFVAALFLASNGIMSMMNAFNSIYKTKENRTWLQMRITATGLTLLLATVLFLSILLLVVGQIALNFLNSLQIPFEELPVNINTVLILRFIVLFLVFLIAISLVYYFGPAVHYKWNFLSVGSFVATLLILAVSYVFSFYVANFGTYNKLYGSIGVMIALMVWLYLVSLAILIGYEINASIHMSEFEQKLEALKAKETGPRRPHLKSA